MAFFAIKSQIATWVQILALHPGKQIAYSKTGQNPSLIHILLITTYMSMYYLLFWPSITLDFLRVIEFVGGSYISLNKYREHSSFSCFPVKEKGILLHSELDQYLTIKKIYSIFRSLFWLLTKLQFFKLKHWLKLDLWI